MTEEHLKEMATLVIYNYFEGVYSKEYIKENFDLAITLMIENSRGRVSGASGISENGISIQFKDNCDKFSLTGDILALLPKKKNYKAW